MAKWSWFDSWKSYFINLVYKYSNPIKSIPAQPKADLAQSEK